MKDCNRITEVGGKGGLLLLARSSLSLGQFRPSINIVCALCGVSIQGFHPIRITRFSKMFFLDSLSKKRCQFDMILEHSIQLVWIHTKWKRFVMS
jgi:hypothetical protein